MHLKFRPADSSGQLGPSKPEQKKSSPGLSFARNPIQKRTAKRLRNTGECSRQLLQLAAMNPAMLAAFGFDAVPVRSRNQDGDARTRGQRLQAGSAFKRGRLQLGSRRSHQAFDFMAQPFHVLLKTFIRSAANCLLDVLLLALALQFLRGQLLLVTLLLLSGFAFPELHNGKMVLYVFVFGALN